MWLNGAFRIGLEEFLQELKTISEYQIPYSITSKSSNYKENIISEISKSRWGRA